MITASVQLPATLWGANMERMAARLLSLLTSDPAQLAAGGRLDVFSRSLAEVAQQCETLAMTPLALRLLCHPAMPIGWKSSLLDALYEQAPESAAQIHRALRSDPSATGLYLRSLERRWEQGSFRALIEETLAREAASPQRLGLWNFAMHELAERGNASTEAHVLALLLQDTAPDEEARDQVEAYLQGTARVGHPAPRAEDSDPEEANGHLPAATGEAAPEVASLMGQAAPPSE
jgi:hypothetical protein